MISESRSTINSGWLSSSSIIIPNSELPCAFLAQRDILVKAKNDYQNAIQLKNSGTLTGRIQRYFKPTSIPSDEWIAKLASIYARAFDAFVAVGKQNSPTLQQLASDFLTSADKQLLALVNIRDQAHYLEQALLAAKQVCDPQNMPWQQPSLSSLPRGRLLQARTTLQMTERLMENFEEFLAVAPLELKSALEQSGDFLQAKATLTALLQHERRHSSLYSRLIVSITAAGRGEALAETATIRSLLPNQEALWKPLILPAHTRSTHIQRAGLAKELLAQLPSALEEENFRRLQVEKAQDGLLTQKLTTQLQHILTQWRSCLSAAPQEVLPPALYKALDNLLQLNTLTATSQQDLPWHEKMTKAGFELIPFAHIKSANQQNNQPAAFYRATRTLQGQPAENYFIKILIKPVRYDIWARANFGERTARLDGPFARILGAFYGEQGVEVLVMEYVANALDLVEILNKNRISYHEKLLLFWQLLQAIEILHTAGLIHKDIKLENIMADDKGILRLVDAGFQEQLSDKNPYSTHYCGTKYYAAPEVVAKQPHGRPADIYSLGVTASLFFQANIQHCNQVIAFPHSTAEQIEAAQTHLPFFNLISRMQFPDAAQRPTIERSMEEFQVYAQTLALTLPTMHAARKATPGQ